MATTSLQDRYNIAIARAQDLQEQLSVKSAEWDKLEKKQAHTEDLARKLCESILEKDRDEHKIGKEYSWDNINVDDLIQKAQASYGNYLVEEKEFLKKIVEESERRREEAAGAYERAMSAGNSSAPLSEEELKKDLERRNAEKETRERADAMVRRTLDSGSLVVEKEEDDLITDEEMSNVSMRRVYERDKDKSVIKIHENASAVTAKKGGRQDTSRSRNFDVDKWDERLSKTEWAVLYEIGGSGESEYPVLVGHMMGVSPTLTKSGVRNAALTLVHYDLLRREDVPTATSKLMMLCLTSEGKWLYKQKTKQDAVPSVLEELEREHGSAEHGLGIRRTAEAIENTNLFLAVQYMNGRKPIDVGNGKKYIPDIVCTKKNSHKLYIEYECGTTAQNGQGGFNNKCNKMCGATDDLYFLAPNRKVEERLAGQTRAWIKSRSADMFRAHPVTVRIGSAANVVRGASILDEDTWDYTFRPAKNGEEPEKQPESRDADDGGREERPTREKKDGVPLAKAVGEDGGEDEG